MVTGMIGDEHPLESAALGHADGYAQHDAVAEGHHRGAHVHVVVVALRNGVGALQQTRLEVLVDEVQGDDDVLNAQTLAVEAGEGYLTGIVVAAIVEGQCKGNLVLVVVEQGHAVHASAQNDQ